jgi:sugar O-acyltransferase (sialic acid O-acetyltransferase NeuD family)
MDKQKVVIIGAGGHAREVLDVIEAINQDTPRFEILGFVVELGYQTLGTVINDAPVLGHFDWLEENRHELKAVCGVGFPAPRYHVIKKLEQIGVEFVNLIHPNTLLTRWITLGTGVIITAGCILTNQITIGNHVHLNRHSNVSHDNVLEDFVTVSPGANLSGNVTLKQGCFIGTGASIIEGKTIGVWAKIGAGSAVIDDIPDNATAVGVPAKVVKTRPAGWHLEA